HEDQVAAPQEAERAGQDEQQRNRQGIRERQERHASLPGAGATPECGEDAADRRDDRFALRRPKFTAATTPTRIRMLISSNDTVSGLFIGSAKINCDNDCAVPNPSLWAGPPPEATIGPVMSAAA